MLQSSTYLDYIYCDLDNSYFTIKKRNQFYFGVREGATGAYYAELMRTKNQAFDTFQKFICQAEHQSKKKLKYLRTDFGKKFVNKTFEKYTSKEGVKWESNVLYTPEQNRKTKRLNYTLMSSVQSI